MRNTITRNSGLVLFLAFLSFGSSSETLAAAGDLDQSFGVQGRQLVTVPNSDGTGGINNSAEDILVQPDGKILVAGYAYDSFDGDSFMIVRFNTDGSLDTDFAFGGVFRFEFESGTDKLGGVALQPDGKIVAAGEVQPNPFTGNTAFAVIRLNPNGSFDNSFGTDGIVVKDFFSSIDEATEVAIQADGRILVSGWVTQGGVNNGLTYDFAVVRYLPNGVIDTSYGTGGVTFTDFNGRGDLAQGSVLQPDGKLVVTGWTSVSGSMYDIGLARYNTDGTLDQSFGIGGKVVTPVGTNIQELVRGIALAPDGKLVVTGDVEDVFAQDGDGDVFAVRYNTDGGLDVSFDGDGKFVYDSNLGDRNEGGQDVIVQPDNKILIAGQSHLISVTGGAHKDMLLLRLNVNGGFDNSFGNNGITRTDFGIFDTEPGFQFSGDEGQSIALQPEGKILVAGNAAGIRIGGTDDAPDGSFDDRLVIARFENDIAAPVTVPASSFVILDGQNAGGGMAEIAASDNTYLSINNGGSRTRAGRGMQVQVETVAPEMTSGSIVFRIESHASASGAVSLLQRIEMFNFSSGQWTTLSESNIGSADSVKLAAINAGASNYVQTGTRLIRSRVTWINQGRLLSPSQYANVDHINFTIGP